MLKKLILLLAPLFLLACSEEEVINNPWTAIREQFGSVIDPDNLENYSNQIRPAYITKDNTNGNAIEDKKAMLGRVLFYDKQLSIDNTVACASCHQQHLAFSSLGQ